jgi:GTP pyrophosphokinase
MEKYSKDSLMYRNDFEKILPETTPEAEKDFILQAIDFAVHAHNGQQRSSGQPYVVHVIEVAKILVSMRADTATIIAGILHDTLEDTETTPEELEKLFGPEIVFLVQGVTKLGHLKYKGVERHVESLRKFFIASSEDIRVVMIKLADRLHNMQTLQHIRTDKQKRIALETLEIHARLADRLGMGKIKTQLEDLAFPYVYPQEYEKTLELLHQVTSASESHLEHVAKTLHEELQILDAEVDAVDYRIKHLYSLWKKLKHFNYDIEKIYDILALRVIVPTVADCYHALGIIHSLYKPIPSRFKDYIALPKPNGYQSLHTAILDGKGEIIEIQIRTADMHTEAEYGIASHSVYKETGKSEKLVHSQSKKHNWARDLLHIKQNMTSSHDFVSTMKLDFFDERLFVYTPKGDVIELPRGATVIDFAYAIHSEIGNTLSSAKVNSKMAPLHTILKQSDMVEVFHNEKSRPSRKWITICKTHLAKHHIRKYLQEHGSIMDKFFTK